MTVLEFRGVRWAYGDGVGFGPIDLRVDDGEWLSVIGHHGSGKSSLLRLAAGSATPSHGMVLVDGVPAGSGAATPLVSAMIHPLPLDDELSMLGHLQLVAGASPDWRDDADDLAGRLGLADRFDDPVRMFSRGMRQKLAICMAFLPEFDVLILDEPFDGLDARSRRVVLELLDLARGYGTTVLIATNDLDAASRGDRVAAIRHGRVIADTSPDADLDALTVEPGAPSNAPREELWCVPMQEFSSISVSSYEAGALAQQLTEQSRDGWSVVAIVPTGSTVTAYLSKEADGSTPVDTDSAVAGDAAADVAPAAAAATVVAATDSPETDSPESDSPGTDSPGTDSPETDSPESDDSPGDDAGDVDAAGETAAETEPGWAAGGAVAAAAATPAVGSPVAEPAATETAPAETSATETAATETSATETAPAETAATGATAEAAGAATAAAAAGAAPAGWYADPSSRFELRYWDGGQWTEHVSRAGQQYTDPPVA